MIELMQHLRRQDLFGQVKTAVQDGSEEAISSLCVAGRFIAEAVEAGWFALPSGRNGSYSRSQHFWIGKLFEAAPWVANARSLAEAESHNLRARIGDSAVESLWSHPQGLPSFVHQARALPCRVQRMPLEWTSGAVTVDLLVQCLEDNFRAAESLKQQISHLMQHRTLEPKTSLQDRVDAMISGGMVHDIPKMLISTLRLYLTGDIRNLLYRGLDGAGLTALLEKRKQDAQEASETGWKEVFREIHWLAEIIDEHGTTEHLGTINRRLKQHAGPIYRIERQRRPLGDTESLTLSLSRNYVAGRHVEIKTVWVFKNWVLALSDLLSDCEPSYSAYVDAEALALKKLDLEGSSPFATPTVRRRPDDFDDELVTRGSQVSASFALVPEIQHSTAHA